jgi:hypothetical protein
MGTDSSPADGVGAFRTSFQSLLARVIESVERRIHDAPEEMPWLTSFEVAFSGLFGEIVEWPECRASLAAALSTPQLRPLTFSAAGVPNDTPNWWVNNTVYPAIERYRGLGPPNTVETKRLKRVTAEVIKWASLDPVPVKSVTPLYHIRIPDGARLRADEQTVIRTLTPAELRRRPERPGDLHPVFLDTPCLISTRDMPRLESVIMEVPEAFLRALRLVLGVQVQVGTTCVAPAVPAFSVSNQGYSTPRAPRWSPWSLREPYLITGRETRKVREVAKAFEDLAESGLDLALESYDMALGSSDPRQSAINVGIALENLYLTGAGSELTYRFRLHVMGYARRLAKCDRVTGDDAAKLYEARSTLVHAKRAGKRRKMKTDDAIQRLNSTGLELVRRTLLSIVSRRNRRYLQSIGTHVDDAVSSCTFPRRV